MKSPDFRYSVSRFAAKIGIDSHDDNDTRLLKEILINNHRYCRNNGDK